VKTALWLALALSPIALAQDDAAAKARALVADLGSDDFEARDRASQALVALGEAAAPALEEARASKDAEVRARADEALALIYLRAQVEPSAWVTLPKGPIAVEEAFKEAARQAGRPFDAKGVNLEGKSMDGTGERMPLWQALDALAHAGGCGLEVPFDKQIALRAEPDPDAPRCYTGPFRLTASIDDLNRQPKHWDLEIQVQCEPHSSAMYLVGMPSLVEVVDDCGNALQNENVASTESDQDAGLGRVTWGRKNLLGVPFQAPKAAAKSLARIKGRLRYLFARKGEEATLELGTPHPKPIETSEGHSIAFVSTGREGDMFNVHLTLAAGTGEHAGAEVASLTVLRDTLDASIRTADGKTLAWDERDMRDGEQVSFTFGFLEVPEGELELHLSWKSDYVSYRFPFEFHDVPLSKEGH